MSECCSLQVLRLIDDWLTKDASQSLCSLSVIQVWWFQTAVIVLCFHWMVWLYLTLLPLIWFKKVDGNWSCSGLTTLDVQKELGPYETAEGKHDRLMIGWTVGSKPVCHLFSNVLSDTPGRNFLSFGTQVFSLIPGWSNSTLVVEGQSWSVLFSWSLRFPHKY